MSSASDAFSTQNRKRYASIGSGIGHATGEAWFVGTNGCGEGMSECQVPGRGSSRLERLETEPGAGLVCRRICDGSCHRSGVVCGAAGMSTRSFQLRLVGRMCRSLTCGLFLDTDCGIFSAVLERTRCLGVFLLSVLPGPSNSSAMSDDSSTKSTTRQSLVSTQQDHHMTCTYMFLAYRPISAPHQRSSRTS